MSEKPIPVVSGDQTEADPAELVWAFPDVRPGQAPYGGRVIVQLRRIKKNAGKIILVEETKENEKWNNMIGKVVAIGPLAFKTRTPWHRGLKEAGRKSGTMSACRAGAETAGSGQPPAKKTAT